MYTGMKKYMGRYDRIFNRKETVNNFVCLLFILSAVLFLVLNRLSCGEYLEELFYRIRDDWGLDFFVFLSDSVLNTSVYDSGESFNPPFLKLAALLVYRSMPLEFQQRYAASAIYSVNPDIRTVFYAVLPFLCLLTFSLSFLSVLVYKSREGNRRERILTWFAVMASMGILFAVERGNFILLAVPFIVFFVMESRDDSYDFALLSLGIASGIKLYPCLFALFYLRERDVKRFIKTLFYCGFFILVPFIYYGGLSSLFGIFSAVTSKTGSGERIGTLNFSSLYWTIGRLLQSDSAVLNHYYGVFNIFSKLFLLLLLFSFFFIKDEWKAWMLLALMIIFYMGTSHTYMLSLLIAPLVKFLNRRDVYLKDWLYGVLFFLSMAIIPMKTAPYIASLRLEEERFTSLGIMEEIVLVVFAVIILAEGIRDFCHIVKNKRAFFSAV